jgi:recombination protein RecT
LYTDIDAFEVLEGEYLGRDKDTGRPHFNFYDSENQRVGKKVVGYAASLELNSGFKKVIYWDYEKMLLHADKYSSAFNAASYDLLKEGKIPEKEKYKYSSFWYTDFDGMAKKTMLRQLISKWGIMSVELQTAYINDTSFSDERGVHYPENKENVVETIKADVEEKTGSVLIPNEEQKEESSTDAKKNKNEQIKQKEEIPATDVKSNQNPY